MSFDGPRLTGACRIEEFLKILEWIITFFRLFSSRPSIDIAPGCATPTEMLVAHRNGASMQKLFPEQSPRWVRERTIHSFSRMYIDIKSKVAQTLAPMPFLNIVPTSGVTLENARQYRAAGAFALGFVNSLFEQQWLAERRFDLIRERATQIVRQLASSS